MRGEWIEMVSAFLWHFLRRMSLPMRGEWIEMLHSIPGTTLQICLSPCGESGLKSTSRNLYQNLLLSLPMRGEWIEIVVWEHR